MRLFSRTRDLNFALQGGGAHGAYTWGVLDRMLEDDQITPRWVSGTSAGAINAVALASGLAHGDRDKARHTLHGVWKEIAQAGVPDFVRMNPFFSSMTKSPAMAHMASFFSPNELNPMGFDPLRDVLEKWIDFKAIRERPAVELIVAATDVRTGQARFFPTREMAVETILASSCLPALHPAVEIDGNAYWDGGFTANPDLLGLAKASPCRDTLIVQLQPLKRPDIPTDAHGISDHVYHLTFLAPFIRDIELIETCREACGGPRQLLPRETGPGRIADHRFHLIDATPHTAKLDWSSKVSPEWEVFQLLFAAGREDMETWLSENRYAIGRYETVDLREQFMAREKAEAVILPKAPTDDGDAPSVVKSSAVEADAAASEAAKSA